MTTLNGNKALRLGHGLGRDLADHLAVLRPDLNLLLSKYPAPAVALQDLAYFLGGGLFLNGIAGDCLQAWGYLKPSSNLESPEELINRLHPMEAGELTMFSFGNGMKERLAFPDLLQRYRPSAPEEQVDLVFQERQLQVARDCGALLINVLAGCTSLAQLREDFRQLPDFDQLLGLLIKCRYLAWEGDRLLLLAPVITAAQEDILVEAMGLMLSSLFTWHQHNITLIQASLAEGGGEPRLAYGSIWPALAGYCSLTLSRVGFFAAPKRGYLPGIVETLVLQSARQQILAKAETILWAAI